MAKEPNKGMQAAPHGASTNGGHAPQPGTAAPKPAGVPRPEVRVDSAAGFESSTAITHVWVPKVGEARTCKYVGPSQMHRTDGKAIDAFEVVDLTNGQTLILASKEASRLLPHMIAGEEVRIQRAKNVRLGKTGATESYDFGFRPAVRARIDAAAKAADERARANAARGDESKG